MEAQLIDWLRDHLPAHPRLKLGIGDDAAILSFQERSDCLVTVDMLTDQVDFHLAQTDPRRVGRKALAVNLSDIAAMAGRPLGAVVSVALPRAGALGLAVGIYEGLLPLAEEFQVAIAGGDTNCWDGPLVISITLLGEVTARGPLRRSGALPGDWIMVTGAFGGSILGRHFDFDPRVNEALLLHERYDLHAGIDVSDGLSLDLSRLAAASGCGACLRLDQIPISPAAHTLSAADPQHGTPLEHALGDGEDFELVLAVPPAEARRMLADQPLSISLSCIGEFIPAPGLWQLDTAGQLQPLTPCGFEH